MELAINFEIGFTFMDFSDYIRGYKLTQFYPIIEKGEEVYLRLCCSFSLTFLFRTQKYVFQIVSEGVE